MLFSDICDPLYRNQSEVATAHLKINVDSKMAPVYVACRLSLATWFMFILFMSLVTDTVNSLLAYDRQTLLDIRLSAKNLWEFDCCDQKTFCSPFLSGIPGTASTSSGAYAEASW